MKTITNLLYKDIRLTAHPTVYLFLSFALMLLIPAYCYYAAIFYVCLAIYFTFLNGRENSDTLYTALLPVSKRDVVKSRYLFIALYELTFIILCIPFALLRKYVIIIPNPAGIESNAAFFGFAMIILGVFNRIFPTVFYRDGISAGKAFAKACLVIVLILLICEASVLALPWAKLHIDNYSASDLPLRIAILFAGIVCYISLTLRGLKLAQLLFERSEL